MKQSTILARAIKAAPEDHLARLAYADALEEEGHPGRAAVARAEAKRLLAEKEAQERCASIAKEILARGITKLAEAKVRDLVGASRCPVLILEGDQPPASKGESGYSTFRHSGTVVQYPGAARRAGHKLDYHRSTRRVEVGALWLAAHGVTAR